MFVSDPHSAVSTAFLWSVYTRDWNFTFNFVSTRVANWPITLLMEMSVYWASLSLQRLHKDMNRESPGCRARTFITLRTCNTRAFVSVCDRTRWIKKVGIDPLFGINHTLAMLRANISRLVRKTWCTTKKINQLANQLAIYIDYLNRVLLTVDRTRSRSNTSATDLNFEKYWTDNS